MSHNGRSQAKFTWSGAESKFGRAAANRLGCCYLKYIFTLDLLGFLNLIFNHFGLGQRG